MSDEYGKRKPAIFHPSPASNGSQLNPQSFTRHDLSGSVRPYSGNITFTELDAAFRNENFRIDEFPEELRVDDNERPKATKFISVYRVLEHLVFFSIKDSIFFHLKE